MTMVTIMQRPFPPMRLLAATALCLLAAACRPAPQTPAPTQPATTQAAPAAKIDEAERIARWQRLGYGMFVHWGLYSELGGVWQGQPVTTGYSEQIQGWAKIPEAEYAGVAERFAAPKFDADAICGLARQAGARYIVVTSKHHDGFVMFDTKSTDYNIVKRAPFGKDPLRLLSAACRKIGLGFGVYFSLVDWHAGHTPETEHNSNPIPASMEPLIEQQLRELMTNYGPIAEVWFDMSAPTPEQSRKFAAIVRELQPQAAINGRIWNNAGDFVTLGDNEAPPPSMQPPFEVPASIYHATWGYRSWQARDDLPGKVRELTRGLVQARAAGGNYLLNIGPMGDGSVVPFEADVLHGIGAWLQRHPQTLQAQPSGLPPQAWGATMRDGDALELFVHDWKAGPLRIAGLASDPSEVRIDGGDVLKWRRDGNDLLIDLPAMAPDPVLPVLRIALPGPLLAVPAQAIAAADDGSWKIAFRQWRAGNSFAFGSGYLTQTTTTVSLDADVASKQAQRVTLELLGARARADRRYRVAVGSHAVEMPGAKLATGTIGPFELPASPATELDIRLADPAYRAEDLGLGFEAAELRSVGASSP